MKIIQLVINIEVAEGYKPDLSNFAKFSISPSEVLDGFDLYRVGNDGNPAQDDYILTNAKIVSVTEVTK